MIIHQMLGTRISDTLTLTPDCLSERNGEIIIRIRQMKTKPYEKPISAELAALIKKAIAYTKEKYGDTTYIFVDEKNPSRPMPYTTVTLSKMVLALVFSVLIYLLLFAITFLVEAVLHFEALSIGLVLENLKTYLLDGLGVFLAISPIIALVARMKKGYWLALVFAEIYSFAGLFASMSGQLKTVYPMTAVFNISGYYDANMVQVLIGIIVLLACAVLALFILKGLNRKAK